MRALVGAQLLDQRVALDDLAAQAREAGLVILGFGVDVLGLGPPEVDLLLGELLGAGLRDLELLLQLSDFRALGLGDLLEMARLLLPADSLGLDGFELMGQDVELLLELVLRRFLAFQLLVEIGSTGFRIA